jgi:hypothetical protein
VLVAVAVALILIFVVFGGNGEATGPEKTVQAYLDAVEAEDIEAVIDLVDPAVIRDLRRIYGTDLEDALAEEILGSLPGTDVKFSNVKYKTTIDEDTATVTVVEGTLEYVDEDGKKQKDNVDQTDLPSIDLILKSGTWYIAEI